MNKELKPELSNRSPYWIDRHRYYELKHFCLQYPIWKKLCWMADNHHYNKTVNDELGTRVETNGENDPTANVAMIKAYYSDRIHMIEQTAKDADPYISDYILKGVTEGKTYDVMNAIETMPCGKNTYYNRYRKFFWLLDKIRG